MVDVLSLAEIAHLSDEALLAQIQTLAQHERETTAALIGHLAVMDERLLHLRQGCSSLFTYCVRVLHCSESAAYRRVEAARVARRYPVVLEMLSAGRINLTTIRLLAPELTPANHRALLEAAAHKSRLDVERLVAGLRPRPPVASTVRRLPTRIGDRILSKVSGPGAVPSALGTEADPANGLLTDPAILPADPAILPADPAGASPPDFAGVASANPAGAPSTDSTARLAPPAGERHSLQRAVVPLSPGRYKVQFTATEETYTLLRQAQDLLRHQIPDGDVGAVVARALRLLVSRLERQKFASCDRPRAARNADPRSRHVPAEVRRAVWLRDGGRCAFVAASGLRCDERAFLEFHHVQAHAAGGEATVDNIELRCRAHNSYEAVLAFGRLRPAESAGRIAPGARRCRPP